MEKHKDLTRQFQLWRIVNQALFVSLAAAVLITLFFYGLTASSPLLGDITWVYATKIGVWWWLSAFGGQITFDNGAISLIPLLFTLFIAAGICFPLKRANIERWHEVAAVTFSGVPTLGIIGLLAHAEGAWWISLIGVSLIGFILSLIAGRKALFQREKENPVWWNSFKPVFKWSVIIYYFASLVTLLGFIIFGMSQAVQIQSMFNQRILGNIGLIVLQLLYLPILYIWAGAWMVGGQIMLGTQSYAGILGSQIGLLPAIPVLGLIPGPDFGENRMALIPIIVFFFAGIILVRALKILHSDFRSFLIASISALLATVLLAEVVGMAGSGSIGPGRMAQFGLRPTQFALFALLLFALPIFFGMLAAHPLTWKKLNLLRKKPGEKFKTKYFERIKGKPRFKPLPVSDVNSEMHKME